MTRFFKISGVLALTLFIIFSFSGSFKKKAVKISFQKISECKSNCDRTNLIHEKRFKDGKFLLKFNSSGECSGYDSVHFDGFLGDTLRLRMETWPGKTPILSGPGNKATQGFPFFCICSYDIEVELSNLDREPSVIFIDNKIADGKNNLTDYIWYIRTRNKIDSNNSHSIKKEDLREILGRAWQDSKMNWLYKKLGNDSIINFGSSDKNIAYYNDGLQLNFAKDSILASIIIFEKYLGELPEGISLADGPGELERKIGKPSEIKIDYMMLRDRDGNDSIQKIFRRDHSYADLGLIISKSEQNGKIFQIIISK